MGNGTVFGKVRTNSDDNSNRVVGPGEATYLKDNNTTPTLANPHVPNRFGQIRTTTY